MTKRHLIGGIFLLSSLLAGCGGGTPPTVTNRLNEAGAAAEDVATGAEATDSTNATGAEATDVPPAGGESFTSESRTPADGAAGAEGTATAGETTAGAKDLTQEVRQGVGEQVATAPYTGPTPIPYVPKPAEPGPQPTRPRGQTFEGLAVQPVVPAATAAPAPAPAKPTALQGGTQQTVLQGGTQQTVLTGGVRTLATGVEDQGNGWVKISLDGGWNTGPSGVTLGPGGDPAWRNYRLQVLRFFQQRAGGNPGQYGSARISFLVNPATRQIQARPVSAYGDPNFTASVEATLRQLVNDPGAIPIPGRR